MRKRLKWYLGNIKVQWFNSLRSSRNKSSKSLRSLSEHELHELYESYYLTQIAQITQILFFEHGYHGLTRIISYRCFVSHNLSVYENKFSTHLCFI